MLKSFSEVTQISALDPGVLPAVIIAPDDGSDLSQTMAYRGQDFLWSISPNWIGALPPGQHLWEWVTTRQAPVLEENLVLWVRSDLFPEQPSDDEGSSELNPSEDGSLLKSGPIE
jgi:hypothetical protein